MLTGERTMPSMRSRTAAWQRAAPTGCSTRTGRASRARDYEISLPGARWSRGVVARAPPRVHVLIREHEPAEALELLTTDQADLALTYDYNLAPAPTDPNLSRARLWTARCPPRPPELAPLTLVTSLLQQATHQ
jgi:hypothetical protein